MKKFEYKTLNTSDKSHKTNSVTLNELGLLGWELVSVVPVVGEGWTEHFYIYLKREIN